MDRKRARLGRAHEMILDVEGAVSLLGVSKHTIYRLISKNKLPTTKVGREWRFHRPTLIQWVAAGSNATQIEHIFKNVQLKKK